MVVRLKGSLFVESCCEEESNQKGVFEALHEFLMIWSLYCTEMMGGEFFVREGDMLGQMAESVKWAGHVMRKHSVSANEKARAIWMNIPDSARPWEIRACCAAELRVELLCYAAGRRSDHIKNELKNALSFLDADPEVGLVIEAHDAVQHAFVVMDALRIGNNSFLLKHHQRGGCGCKFQLFAWHDDAANVDSGA